LRCLSDHRLRQQDGRRYKINDLTQVAKVSQRIKDN
jgi:hypothetical protein